MIPRIDYWYDPDGGNFYAKAEPLNTGTWSTGVIDYAPNGSTGSYAATLDAATPYAVYKRLGGSPASSDELVGFVPVDHSVLVKAILGNAHNVTANANGTYTIEIRNDANSATLLTIVYNPATGERSIS